MKRILTIIATLALCTVIVVVPCFAFQSGYYEGQAMVHLLGGQYQVELMGVNEDALVLFDTRDMYWYDASDDSLFDSTCRSDVPPDCYYYNTIEVDYETMLIYNDLQFTINYRSDFPTADTIATTYMVSDRFTLDISQITDARIGLHLNPIMNADTYDYLAPIGSVVQGQITIYCINTNGDIFEETIGRDDLVVGGTYDLLQRIRDLQKHGVLQYYWIEYEGEGVIPTFVQDIDFQLGIPTSEVRPVSEPTDITYPEVVDYTDFNLLQWISTAVDGFMRAPLFVLGDFTVTLGAVLAVGITVPIFVAFLRRYAGG